MKASKLNTKAKAYNRKRYKNRIAGLYKAYRKVCKFQAKKGSYRVEHIARGGWDGRGHFPEELIAARLFQRKHKDFTVKIIVLEYDAYIHGEREDVPCKWKIIIDW